MGAASLALDKIHGLIRSGRVADARVEIHRLSSRRLTRPEKLKLAHQCTHANLHAIVVRLLHRLVRPPGKKGISYATPEEIFEYGRALVSVGAVREGTSLLETIEIKRLPRTVIALSWAHFFCWDWNRALPYLREWQDGPGMSDHDRVFVKARLATAMLHGLGDLDGAQKILLETLGEARKREWRRLWMFSMQLLAQRHFLAKDWPSMVKCLDERKTLYNDVEAGAYNLVDRKWRVLMEIGKSGRSKTSLAELAAVEKGCRDQQLWEELRTTEYYAGLSLGDLDRLTRLYYGTPFPGARAKFLKAMGRDESGVPDSYVFELGPEGARGEAMPTVSVLDGANPLSTARLKPGQAQQRMLHALAADFYAEPTSFLLHERVYPGDRYNPSSSPVRVSQVLKRLRAWIRTSRLPIQILENDGLYRLSAEKRIGILLRKATDLVSDGGDGTVQRVGALALSLDSMGSSPFRAQDVESRLGLRRSAAVALLREAMGQGQIERLGSGPGTRYRFTKRA